MREKSVILLFCLLSFAGAKGQNTSGNFQTSKNMEIFGEILKYLDFMYVDTLRADRTVGYGINAMLASLDPYTAYYPQEKMKDVSEMTTGKFGGIGAVVRYNFKQKNVVIEQPSEGMPAQKAGLKKGDMILEIDGKDMRGKDVQQVTQNLRGDPGTAFSLKVQRPGEKSPREIKITRSMIETPPVPYFGMLSPETGYIKFTEFTEGSAQKVRNAVVELRQKGAQRLILDLRGNGGGSETEAVDIVGCFVPKGSLVVSNRGKLLRANHDFKTAKEPVDETMPLAVLVNGYSASASEITAGALQDMDRALIVGEKTFGKGLVQSIVDVPYNGKLKLTTNKYYIPSGRCIQAIDYLHGEGGYKKSIPDSLKHTFQTLGGRKVRDGGGIEPDVVVKPDSLTNLCYYLSANGLDSTEVLHDYIVSYIHSHEGIAPAKDFSITDEDFQEFKQQVIKSGFKYDQESEKALKDLEEMARFEGYYDRAKEEFAALRAKLSHDLLYELDFNKEQIRRIINNAIVGAYYFQKGQIENSLSYDKQLQKAVAELQLLEGGKITAKGGRK